MEVTHQMYYISIGLNLVTRLMWTLTISPSSIGILMDPTWFATILAAVEIARRAQWNAYNLENEQLANREKLRAFSIPPLQTRKVVIKQEKETKMEEEM